MSYDTLPSGRPALPTRSHTQAVSDRLPLPTTSRSTELIDFCKSFTEDRTFEARVYLRIRKESVRSKKETQNKPRTNQEQTKDKPRTSQQQTHQPTPRTNQEQTKALYQNGENFRNSLTQWGANSFPRFENPGIALPLKNSYLFQHLPLSIPYPPNLNVAFCTSTPVFWGPKKCYLQLAPAWVRLVREQVTLFATPGYSLVFSVLENTELSPILGAPLAKFGLPLAFRSRTS